MNTFIYMDLDSTIYKHKSIENLNTGLDEILELQNTYSETAGHQVSRILLKFNIDPPATQHNPFIDCDFFLNLKITESYELTGNLVIEFLPLKSTWEEGYGRKFDNIVSTNGVTWNFTGQTDWEVAGGDYYREHELEQNFGISSPKYKFKKRTSDISVDITDYVHLWNAGIIENNGLIIKFKTETIASTGQVKFFSKDTNTIYQPHAKTCSNDFKFDPCKCLDVTTIECVYDEQVKKSDNLLSSLLSGTTPNEISGSVDNISGTLDCKNESPTIKYNIIQKKPDIEYIDHDNVIISLVGINSSISVKEQLRIKVSVREKYPTKVFKKKSRYSGINFIDSPMYYSVIDADTKERVVDFNKYSRISCNESGHYFDFDFGCLSVERLYFFEIRVEFENQTKIFTEKIKFVVER